MWLSVGIFRIIVFEVRDVSIAASKVDIEM